MNILNRYSLLVYLLVYSIGGSLIAAIDVDTLSSDRKSSTKDLVIVNFDAELDQQLVYIADYVYDVYHTQDKPALCIKAYSTSADDVQTVLKLVQILTDKGIDQSSIRLYTESQKGETAYFTLAVASAEDVQ